uniref:Secreted protein n=1 Tax=Nothobranchius kadleci TaxID=1051664 RepID=A0A1A8CMW9_NOTKA
MIKPHSLVIRSALCFLALPSVVTSNVLSRSRPNFLSSQDLPASSLNRGVCFTQYSSWLQCFSLFIHALLDPPLLHLPVHPRAYSEISTSACHTPTLDLTSPPNTPRHADQTASANPSRVPPPF